QGGQDGASATASITVASVNHAPSGFSIAKVILEDQIYTFAPSDFIFFDLQDSPANALKAVKITALPSSGTLTLNNVPVPVGTFVNASDIAAGNFKFVPPANFPPANSSGNSLFKFQIQDDGGTANGGVDLDPNEDGFNFNVTRVNDAPAGADALR